MLKKILLAIAITAALAFCLGVALDSHPLRLATKGIPVAALLLYLASGRRHRDTLLIMAGLCTSLIGDLLLEISPQLFVPGLLAFLTAHLLYIGAFLSRSRRPAPLRLLPSIIWGSGIWLLLAPHLGPMALPVLVYILVIFSMIWRAAACIDRGAPLHRAALLALAGAVLFGISDSLLATSKFLGPFPALHYPIIITYWLGQAGIAFSTKK